MKTILLFLCLLAAGKVFAHDLYLRATPFHATAPFSAKLSMFLAESFPGEYQTWRLAKTKQFQWIGPGFQKGIEHKATSDPLIDLKEQGTYVFGWTSTPSYISLEAQQFNEYLEAEGYQNVIQTRIDSGQSTKSGREKYTRYLKSHVQAGSKLTDNYKSPFGYKIEILPMINPYSIEKGNKVSFRLLFDGKPLGNHRMVATHTDNPQQKAQTVFTDDEGTATFVIDKAGVWLIRSNHMLPAQEDPQANWESFWANCSFAVK